jgi:hypothetical protein
MKSVTTALPFLKRRPEIAGRKAKAKDSDGKDDDSSVKDESALLGSRGWGFKKSRASLRLYSEKFELRRGGMESKLGDAGGWRRDADAASSATDTVMERRSPWPEGGALKPELTPAAGLPEEFDVVFSSTMTEAQSMAFFFFFFLSWLKSKYRLGQTWGR